MMYSAAIVAASLISSSAFAHTTSLGYVPGTTAGSVTFWTGSYQHGGTVGNEGVGTLTSILTGISQSQSFVLGPVFSKPAGLVDGTNNFFWGANDGTSYPFPLSVDPVLFGGDVTWQGVSFSGLTPGDYTFGCGTVCGTTQQWASLNGAGDTVGLTLTGADIGGGEVGAAPEPGTWAMMIGGFGMVGASLRTRRRKTTVTYA